MILKLKNKNLEEKIKDKRPISIKIYIYINKIVVSTSIKFSSGKKSFKYFNRFRDAKKLDFYAYFFQKLVHIEKTFDETKFMSFLIKDDELLKKYNATWKKVENTIYKVFDSDPVYKKVSNS